MKGVEAGRRAKVTAQSRAQQSRAEHMHQQHGDQRDWRERSWTEIGAAGSRGLSEREREGVPGVRVGAEASEMGTGGHAMARQRPQTPIIRRKIGAGFASR